VRFFTEAKTITTRQSDGERMKRAKVDALDGSLVG